jgi:hypothetical protein
MMTTPRGRHPAAAATVPRSELPQVRMVLGAAAAAVGLFAALHWIVLPGDHLWLDQKNRRTESVAALDSAKAAGTRRKAAADRVAGAHPAARERAAAVSARRRQTQKTAPRTAGKPIGSAPVTKQPGAPAAGDPTASRGEGPAATETPAVNQDAPSSTQQPSPPPPPPPPPIGLPQLPQLPQVPEVPQVPVPSVPDLPTPQVPSVPTPQLPTLP